MVKSVFDIKNQTLFIFVVLLDCFKYFDIPLLLSIKLNISFYPFFRLPNFWVPHLKHAVLYSEILNEYMKVTVTERTLKLIDENCGFDHYILGVSFVIY